MANLAWFAKGTPLLAQVARRKEIRRATVVTWVSSPEGD